MKKEKKMRKKIIGFMVAGVLVLGLGFVSTPARAELSLGLVGGYYSPNFGKINDDLDEELNDIHGTEFEFKAGMMYGLALGYDLPARFGLRLEYNSFDSKTSDTLSSTWDSWEYREDLDLKLTVTPVMLSLLYGFSPFYIGAGVGSFSTKFKITDESKIYWNGILVESDSFSYSGSDTPTGLVLLAGYGFGGEPVFLNLEARYVVGTKAKIKVAETDIDTEVDLSGLQLSLLAGFKF